MSPDLEMRAIIAGLSIKRAKSIASATQVADAIPMTTQYRHSIPGTNSVILGHGP